MYDKIIVIIFMSQNYYDILGVSKTASKDDIKKAYKKLALKHHPDKNLDDVQGAKKRFTKVAQAYAVLSDDSKRASYDNPPPPPPPQQNFYQNSQPNQARYQWKNPEFESGFKHFEEQQTGFQNMKGRQKYKAPNMPQFNMFSMFGTFKPFTNLNQGFGSFTFQMAQQIFSKVFRQDSMQRQLPHSNLQLKRIESTPPPSQPYQPKNSTLLSEKTIERNGRMILVRKFSVQENGRVNKYTHQSVIR